MRGNHSKRQDHFGVSYFGGPFHGGRLGGHFELGHHLVGGGWLVDEV